MKIRTFAGRNAKELLRDPLTVIMSLGFPLVILILLTAIQANIPLSLFEIDYLTPGVGVFGLSFMTLFTATLIAKDRESALLQRLYTAPMTAVDFILGYTLPVLPIALGQCLVTYGAAFALGMKWSVHVLAAIGMMVPVSLFYIGLGLLFGSLLNVKQVGGICGSLLTNVAAFLSGIWFDVSMVGAAFETVAKVLPFWNAVELERAVAAGNYADSIGHLLAVMAYTVVICVSAVLLFLRQMKQ